MSTIARTHEQEIEARYWGLRHEGRDPSDAALWATMPHDSDWWRQDAAAVAHAMAEDLQLLVEASASTRTWVGWDLGGIQRPATWCYNCGRDAGEHECYSSFVEPRTPSEDGYCRGTDVRYQVLDLSAPKEWTALDVERVRGVIAELQYHVDRELERLAEGGRS